MQAKKPCTETHMHALQHFNGDDACQSTGNLSNISTCVKQLVLNEKIYKYTKMTFFFFLHDFPVCKCLMKILNILIIQCEAKKTKDIFC